MHLKGLLDRVGVQADFLHVGAFKGAAEPLTRDAPSPEMLETLEAIVDRSYHTLLSGLEARGLSSDDAAAAVDTGLFLPEAAEKARLVDEVAVWEAFLAAQTEGAGWRRAKAKEGGPLAGLQKIQRFLGMLPPEGPSGPHVAVVYAVGNIIDGKGEGIIGAREEIASRTLVAALRAVARDDDVKAVVMRVDSGGGSALASEQIWHAANELAQRKPLVVSMGAVAASGGYYISAAAAKIFARNDTLTGSIGVVGGKLVFGDALGDVGIKTYDVHRGQRATMWSSLHPWNDEERKTVQTMMEDTYEVFLSRVAAGRKMDCDAVHEVAQGRVWTGADAKDKGLVDEIGGLGDAVAEAARLGGVEAGTDLQVYPPNPTLRDILHGLGQVQAPLGAGTEGRLGAAAATWLDAAAGALAGADPVLLGRLAALLRTVTQLHGKGVWTVSFVSPPM